MCEALRSTSAKKRQNLAFSVKVEIIREVEKSEKSDVAAAYSIPKSTLSTLLKNKASIKKKANERLNASGARRVRTPACNDVEKALYKWFVTICDSNIPVSGPMLQQKALEFTHILSQDDFSAGSRWLQRFKDHYDIVGKVVTGERCAVDVDNVKKWVERNWPGITSNYHSRDIFNADETGLFWQMLPSKTEFPRCFLPRWKIIEIASHRSFGRQFRRLYQASITRYP